MPFLSLPLWDKALRFSIAGFILEYSLTQTMVDFSNRWKFLSFGLMAILATGLVAPQAYADAMSSLSAMVQNIQSQVNNTTYGLQAINNHISSANSTLHADLSASRTALNSHIDAAAENVTNQVNAHTDSALTSIAKPNLQETYGECTLGANREVEIDSDPTEYVTIYIKDRSNSADWTIADVGKGPLALHVENLPSSVSQSVGHYVLLGGPQGLNLAAPADALLIDATGSAASGDFVSVFALHTPTNSQSVVSCS